MSIHETVSRAIRVLIVVLGTAIVAAAATGNASDLQKAPRPNILFIMSDDHAAHAISAYGSRINRTPNIDRLATGGARLANCFVTNSVCAPSRAAILTGKYSHRNGLRTNRDTFDGAQQTVPKLLKAAGYQTAVIGKWHLKSDPTGFDYWNILPGQGIYHNPDFIDAGGRKHCKGYVTDIITSFTIGWIEARDPAKPFFVMCHNKAPHRMWQPDAKHADMYENEDIPEPATFNDDYSGRGMASREAEMRIDKDLTTTDVKQTPPTDLAPAQLKHWKYERYIKDYLRCVASVDDNVGRLLDYLDKAGLTTSTVVIYTSDQGFFLGDHNWFDKRFMYEESLRMPFLVRYPGVTRPGALCEPIALNVDFAPTFLEIAGATVPDDMQGRSLVPLLAGQTPGDWRKAMYYHYFEFPAEHAVHRHYGIRTERYKLIRFYEGLDEWEFFDLKKDPDEMRSGYNDPAYAETIKELKSDLKGLRVKLGDTDGPALE